MSDWEKLLKKLEKDNVTGFNYDKYDDNYHPVEKTFSKSKKPLKEKNLMKGRSDLKKKGDKYSVETDLNIKKNLDPKVKRALKKSIVEEVNERLKGSGFDKVEFSDDEETEGRGIMIGNVEQYTPKERREKQQKADFKYKQKLIKEQKQIEKEEERIKKRTIRETNARLKRELKKSKKAIKGGDIFGDIKKTFSEKGMKKVGKTIETGIKDTGKDIKKGIVKTANTVDKWAKKVDLGGYVEDIKKIVPQSTMTIILTSALEIAAVSTGNPALVAMAPVLAGSATSAFYKADFSKKLAGQGEAVGISAIRGGIQSGIDQSATASAPAQSGSGFKDTFKTVKALAFGQSDYTANVKKIFNQYENQPISKMTIVRTPVNSAILGAMDTISLGNFTKKMDKANFDELYHLQIEITLGNGQVVTVEKTEVVNIRKGKTKHADKEEEMVDNIPNITFGDLMRNAQKLMGSKFFTYSAKNNNCQDFALALLQGSNIGNDSDYTFIKQNTKQLFKNQGFLNKVSNTLTDVGAKGNILMHGGSAKRGRGRPRKNI
jgi:hypothetical protein